MVKAGERIMLDISCKPSVKNVRDLDISMAWNFQPTVGVEQGPSRAISGSQNYR